MTSRLLTPQEMCRITGTENPLTPADRHAIVRRFYTPHTAAAVLAARSSSDLEQARPTMPGGTGTAGGAHLTLHTDRRGIWARIAADPPRAGHLRWADAEAIIRRAATPDAAAELIAAADACTAHEVAYAAALEPYRFKRHKPPYDATTGIRLERAARAAWERIIDAPAEPVQLDLWEATA